MERLVNNCTYDASGNRKTDGNTVELTGNNRQGADAEGYTYDAEGNRTAKFKETGSAAGELDAGDGDATVYTWDYRNWLTDVTHYDALGQLTTETQTIYGLTPVTVQHVSGSIS
jgi:YD repeat-containing protein